MRHLIQLCNFFRMGSDTVSSGIISARRLDMRLGMTSVQSVFDGGRMATRRGEGM